MRWKSSTIDNEQLTIDNYLIEEFDNVYYKSRKIAIDKTGLSPTIFPETCPYTVEQVLDSEFLPD